MTFNMEHTNTRNHDICAFIADADPDIVLIQEIDAAGAAELARALEPSYMHMSHVGRSRKVGLALFSRSPALLTAAPSSGMNTSRALPRHTSARRPQITMS